MIHHINLLMCLQVFQCFKFFKTVAVVMATEIEIFQCQTLKRLI
jgi:hypothetical protein